MNRLTAARLGYGMVLLAVPGLVVRAYGGRLGGPDRAVARVLGWRQVVQAAACTGSPGASVLLLGAETDVAHALSAVAFAIADRPRRRAGLTEGLLAFAFAAAGFATAQRAAPGGPGSGSHEAGTRLARWRQRAADRVAGLAVPAAVRRWAAHGEDAR
ncbi:MAG: hypothetical protein ACRDNF_11080 [Streptosporangiaceae bacterium]